MPPFLLGAILLFATLCAFCFGSTHNMMYVFLSVPMIIILIVLPLLLTYFTEKQIRKNIMPARCIANHMRIRQITAAMRGKTVIVEGKILKVSGQFMNKPTFIIEDSTGKIAVKRFVLPEILSKPGDTVEVLGRIYGKANGIVFINALTIEPISDLHEIKEDEDKPLIHKKEPIHIKRYN